MAATVSSKPAVPPPKIKRPAPPTLQTSLNGTLSQLSPTSTISNKRPRLENHSSNAIVSSNGVTTSNGTNPRVSNRRKEPQKPSEGIRARKFGIGDGAQGERRTPRKVAEPYLKTTSYILRKYRNSPPSFILHLHPTHFRLDDQDGIFLYNSPMKVLLEHVKEQTVPHDMVDHLLSSDIKFYGNNLIVQIHDHRSNINALQTTSNASKKDRNQPFSIHNYNQYLTPSPHVPYPCTKASDESENAVDTNSSQSREADAAAVVKVVEDGEPDAELITSSVGPKIFTTVLFHTPMALQEEMLKYACTPDLRSNRKQSQANGRAPASATMPHPPTQSSTGPGSSAPPAKKQKMRFSSKELMYIESKIISATAPSLFLEPVQDLMEAQSLLRKLQDPLCKNEPPAPKLRKRTVKELEADEALAAEEQRFMLIMDERLVATSTGSGVGNSVGPDSETGVGTFEARFEKFKALEEIKELHQENKQREAEAKAQAQAQQHQQQQKAKLEQQEKERMLEQLRSQEANSTVRLQQEQMRLNQLRQQSQQGHQAPQHQKPTPHQQIIQNHPPTSSATIANTHPLVTTQPRHSSPVIRNMTPQNASSPLMMSRPSQGVPMTTTSSNQGVAASSPRPGSAMQHAHPTAVAMAKQRSQQVPSRNGTPSMPTPRLQQGTPVMQNVTPTPRMSHASPINATVTPAPVMGHPVAGVPHPHQVTQQQQMQLLMYRQQQLAQVQLRQQQMQGSPPNHQVSPQNLHHLASQQAALAQQREEAYRSQSFMQQQMNMQNGHNVRLANGIPMQQGQIQFAGVQQQMPDEPNWKQMYSQGVQTLYGQLRMTAINQYGNQESIPPMVLNQMRNTATSRAKNMITMRRQHWQQQHQQAGMGGMVGMGGMNGMSGMDGLGGI